MIMDFINFQSLILQLRNRLAESEKEQDTTLQEKNASLDDLHRRLKQNVECIQQLNRQVIATKDQFLIL